MTTVLTYGTFDMLHVGHLNLLRRARALGDRLVVGLSTDEFNQQKGKVTVIPYEDRKLLLESLRFVDHVIPETDWQQKIQDVLQHQVDHFCMGADWQGRFDFLQRYCDVVYLPRTENISTTMLKRHLRSGSTGFVRGQLSP